MSELISGRWYYVEDTQRLDGNGFFASYNESTDQLTGFPVLDSLMAGEEPRETALCREAATLILTGDWRQQYEDRIDEGWDRCYEFYQRRKTTNQSKWSTDYEEPDEN